MSGVHHGTGRRSQFEALSAVYDRFGAELIRTGDPQAMLLAASWQSAKVRYVQWLLEPDSGVTRAKLVGGMRQGLRDIPLVVGGFPAAIRTPLLSAFECIVEEEIPGFASSDRSKLARALERGRVRNRDEWDVVRHRIDEIETNDRQRKELERLHRLLESFERVAGPRS
jgi:hypothetical protein